MSAMTKFEVLKKRSQLLQSLRAFFYAQSVIEVDTPQLSQAATPDVHLDSLLTQVQIPGVAKQNTYYLHTSPEYPMKRLLCEGVGDCFYLGKVFRDGDLSPRHQVEFTLLEWYRLGFSLQDLVNEVVTLLQNILVNSAWPIVEKEQLSYQQAFAKYAQIDDIFSATALKCRQVLQTFDIPEVVGVEDNDKVLWEQLVLTEVIEPQLGAKGLTVITHFPARDAALARISSQDTRCAERFEVYVKGMELANGYFELADAQTYHHRFQESLDERVSRCLPAVPLDERLLQSLEQLGLPDCSGVALGVDRLFALQQGFSDIAQGLTYGIEQA